jgi:hypothetical protein
MDSDHKLIGSAVLYREGSSLFAECVVTRNIPERLDYENGEPLYLNPHTIWTGEQIIGEEEHDKVSIYTVVTITGLDLLYGDQTYDIVTGVAL